MIASWWRRNLLKYEVIECKILDRSALGNRKQTPWRWRNSSFCVTVTRVRHSYIGELKCLLIFSYSPLHHFLCVRPYLDGRKDNTAGLSVVPDAVDNCAFWIMQWNPPLIVPYDPQWYPKAREQPTARGDGSIAASTEILNPVHYRVGVFDYSGNLGQPSKSGCE